MNKNYSNAGNSQVYGKALFWQRYKQAGADSFCVTQSWYDRKRQMWHMTKFSSRKTPSCRQNTICRVIDIEIFIFSSDRLKALIWLIQSFLIPAFLELLILETLQASPVSLGFSQKRKPKHDELLDPRTLHPHVTWHVYAITGEIIWRVTK